MDQQSARKKIIIIGGGISGLAAGCFARINGFDVDLYEKHLIAGGLCTGWKRGAYQFEFNLFSLTGVRDTHPLYNLWNSVGAFRGRDILDITELYSIEIPDYGTFHFYSDLNLLKSALLELAPEDSDAIDRWIDWAFEAAKGAVDITIAELTSRPIPPLWSKLQQISFRDFEESFSNIRLRQLIRLTSPDSEAPVARLIQLQGMLHSKMAGWPTGGSIKIAESVKHRFTQLGGEFYPGTGVESVLFKGKKACGVTLEGGREVESDYVISAVDGLHAVNKIISRPESIQLQNRFRDSECGVSRLQLSFGVPLDLSQRPPVEMIPLPQPIQIGSRVREALPLRHLSHDALLSDERGTSFSISLSEDYDAWAPLKEDYEIYSERKVSILKQVMEIIVDHLKLAPTDIQVTDVATPLTVERYTGNYRGTVSDWKGPEPGIPGQDVIQVTGLQDLFIAGQWLRPGEGMAGALLSGRQAVLEICKKEGSCFIDSPPVDESQ